MAAETGSAALVDAWPLGASCAAAEGRTRFLVWAPRASRVAVQLVAQPTRVVELVPQVRGYFAGEVCDCRPGERYWLLVDGQTRPDPASRSQPEGVFGPSEIVDLRFEWDDLAYRGRPLDEYVIYELHVGAYTRGGTLDHLVPHLDRLVDLGVTALQLMPVAQFSGAHNWGYDGVFPFAVQNSYGGPAALQRLVDACHARQLAVILDVVYNHLGPEGACLAEFGPYFSEAPGTPWGPGFNFDGSACAEVRRYFLENARQWWRDFHVDALRLDAVHAIRDTSPRTFLHELASEGERLASERGSALFTIAECNCNDPRFVQPARAGGVGLSAQYLDDFQRALHALQCGERSGHYADFGTLDAMAAAIRAGFVLSGQYSHYRRRAHGQSSAHVEPQRLVAYAQNHDTVGNRPDGARPSRTRSLEQLKLAAAVLLLSPYPPQLFMGEEYAEPAPFLYFVDHVSPKLRDVVRQGRRRDFAAYFEGSNPPDPAAPETFRASQLDLTLASRGLHAQLWYFYQRLLSLRREKPILRQACREQVTADVIGEQNCLVIRYESPAESLAALFNFGVRPVPVIALVEPDAVWHVLFDSASDGETLSTTAPESPSAPAVSRLLGPQGAMLLELPRSA